MPSSSSSPHRPKLTSPNGKILTFKVAAYDEAGLIGEGTHQRAIVAKERFEQKAQSKLAK